MRSILSFARVAVFMAGAGWAVASWGQAPPTAEHMIEQLKAPAAGGQRTRSLRNLTIESTTAKPSLSLLIQFDFDSARLRPESLPALDNLGTALNSEELKASKFAIEGHTDAKGRPDYNLRLSDQRAQAVLRYMVLRGVDPARLAASGKGSTEPANAADPLAAENRRVRIVNTD
jgi:outer membrane protein OmpA-like peptidoglycan-associated protein